jgi:hypothetical protein
MDRSLSGWTRMRSPSRRSPALSKSWRPMGRDMIAGRGSTQRPPSRTPFSATTVEEQADWPMAS